MAVVAVKSAQITNRDATPRVLNNSRVTDGSVRHARDIVALANGDSIASTYRVVSIPSNAVVISVRITCPDIGTTAIADVGLYKTTSDGGAVVDADFFGSAVVLSGGALSKSEVVYESAVVSLANAAKPVWEQLALGADPGIMYDVTLTLTAASDAAANLMVEVDFVI